MPDSSTAVEFREVGKDFGDKRVLDGFSLSVGAGETVALIGPSGCGKTTALKLVNRLLEPDSGTVRVLGRDGNLILSATDPANNLAGPLLFTTSTTPGLAMDGIFYYTGKGLN